MDAIEAIQYMIKDSGANMREVSRQLGNSPNFLATEIYKNVNISASYLAQIAQILGYRLILKKDGIEIEVKPRANKNKRTANK